MNIKKIISLLTILCFLMTFSGQNLLWAAAENEAANRKIGAAEFGKIFEDIPLIPARYGKITSVSNSGSAAVAVNIQDLHCHPEAQKNINNIIGILDKNYKVRGIFVEGAYGKVDTGWLCEIKDKSLREAVAGRMMEDGMLNASEYYAATNDKKDFLLGLEDKSVHEKNIKRLGYILSRQKIYSETLSKIRKNMEYWDAKYTNIRNKRFNKTLDKYRRQEISTERFYVILCKYMKKINKNPQDYNNVLPVKLSDYPNMENYLLVSRLNSEIDMKKVQIQLQALLAFLKAKLPQPAFQMFLDETGNLSDIEKLAAALFNFSRLAGINLNINYGQLNAFFKLQQLSRNINPLDLIAEERHLTERLRAALSYDGTELEISFLNDFASYFSDYLQNKLLADDFAYFDSRFEDFRKLYAKYAVINDLADIEEDFSLLTDYYKLNDKRNDIFAENIFKKWDSYGQKAENTYSDNPEEIFKKAKEIVIVVTGGYHSYGLKRLFAENGITSVIITPSVTTDIEQAEITYEEIVKSQSEFLTQALAFTVISQAENAMQYRALAQASISFLQNTKYTSSNISDLAQRLKSVVHNSDIKITEGETETSIRFKDGKTITIVKNEKGLMELKKDGAVFAQAKPRARLKKNILAFARDVFSYSPSMLAMSSLMPDIGALFTGYIRFAEERNLFLEEYGLTMAAADYAASKKEPVKRIYGIELNALAKLPEPLQNAFLKAQKEADKRAFEEKKVLNGKEPGFKENLLKIAASVIIALGIFSSLSLASKDNFDFNFPAGHAETVEFSPAPNLPASRIISATGAVKFFLGEQINENASDARRADSPQNIENSLRESQKKESVDIVKEAYLLLQNKAGIVFAQQYPVLFLQNVSGGRINSSSSEAEHGFIIIPAEILKGKSRQEQVGIVAVKIAYEASRIKNKYDIASGKMTRLQNEAEAFKTMAQAMKTAPGYDKELKNRRHIAQAFRHINGKSGAIMSRINRKEPGISFSDLYYSDIETAGSYNEKHADQIPDETVLIKLFNAKYGNAGNAPYEYAFLINTKTGRIINAETGDEVQESRLELSGTKSQADKLGLKGFRRAFFAARTEFIPSLKRGFAQRHISFSEKSARLRKTGDIVIKSATAAGAVTGLALSLSLSASFLSFVSLPALIAGGSIAAAILTAAGGYGFNITAHTLYNLFAPKGSELTLEKKRRKFYYAGLPEDFDFKRRDISGKRQKKDREYGEFYLFDETRKEEAYAGKTAASEIEISEDAKIYELAAPADAQRISRSELRELFGQGYDMISGLNSSGAPEYILINKGAVENCGFERFADEDEGFQVLSNSENTDYLEGIIKSADMPAILKFHAFNRLGRLNYDLSEIGKTLVKEAEPLLRDYIANDRKILEENPHRNAKLGAIGAAEIILLKSRHPGLVKFDYNRIAKETAEFRWTDRTFAPQDGVGIEFGKDYIYGQKAFLVFLQLAVHEFAHKIQFELVKDFEQDRINNTVSEIFADSFSLLLSAELELDLEPFKNNLGYIDAYESVTNSFKTGTELERSSNDSYELARSFLYLLLENNGGNLSVSQIVKLAESVFSVIEESAGVYAELDREQKMDFIKDFRHYFGGTAEYFKKILSLWSGEKVELPKFNFRDIQYGKVPEEEIFKKAVEDNIKNFSFARAKKTAGKETAEKEKDADGFFALNAENLAGENKKTAEMIALARRSFNLSADKRFDEKEAGASLAGLYLYIKKHLDELMEQNRAINLSLPEDMLFLSTLSVFTGYFSAEGLPKRDFKKFFPDIHAYDKVWGMIFYALPAANPDDFEFSRFVADLLKSFSFASEEYADDFAVRSLEIFESMIESLQRRYKASQEIPRELIESAEEFFISSFEFAPGRANRLNKLRELMRGGRISSLQLKEALKRLYEKSVEISEKNALGALKAALERKEKLLSAVAETGSIQAVEYQFLANETDNDIADFLNFAGERNLTLPEDISAKLDALFKGESAQYLEILRIRNDNDALARKIKDSGSLKIKLFAFLQLRLNGYAKEAEGLSDSLTKEALNALKIENDFDLKASLTGVHLLLMSELAKIKELKADPAGSYIKAGGEIKLFRKIAAAALCKEPFNTDRPAKGNSFFQFSDKSVKYQAHELGHNYLFALAENLTPTDDARAVFHEFFAYISQSLLMPEAAPFKGKFLDFDLFAAYGQPLQESHEAAMGFFNILQNVMTGLGHEFSWAHLAKAALLSAKKAAKQDYESQSALLVLFLNEFAETAAREIPSFDKDAFTEAMKDYSTLRGAFLLVRKTLLENSLNGAQTGNYARTLMENDFKIADNYLSYDKKQLEKVFSSSEIQYLEKVIRHRNDIEKLKAAAQDPSNKILHRIFALNLLAAANVFGDYDALIKDFAAEYASGKIKIENNYDLRAVLTAISFYLTADFYEKEDPSSINQKLRAVCLSIMTAVMPERGADASEKSLKEFLRDEFFEFYVYDFFDDLQKKLESFSRENIILPPAAAGKNAENAGKEIAGRDKKSRSLSGILSASRALNADFGRLFSLQAKNEEGKVLNLLISAEAENIFRGKNVSGSLISLSYNTQNYPVQTGQAAEIVRDINFSAALALANELFKDRDGFDPMSEAEQISDILNNAFVHGNNMDLSKNILIYISENGNEILVINEENPEKPSLEKLAAAGKASLFGAGIGTAAANDYMFARTSDGEKNLFIGSILTGLSKDDGRKDIAGIEWKSPSELERTNYPVFEIPGLAEGMETDVSAVSGKKERFFTLEKRNGEIILKNLRKFKRVSGIKQESFEPDIFELAEENGKIYMVSEYSFAEFGAIRTAKSSFAQDDSGKHSSPRRQKEKSLSETVKDKLDLKTLDLDLSKVFTDFKIPAEKYRRQEAEFAGSDLVAGPEIIHYVKSLFTTMINGQKSQISLNDTVLTLDFGKAPLEFSRQDYRTASNVLLLVAGEIAHYIEESGHFRYRGVYRLDRDIFEILKNAFVHGNALDFSKPVTVIINNEGIFVINEDAGAAPSLKQREGAFWAGLYGRGSGLVQTSKDISAGYLFSKTETGGKKIFAAFLGSDKKALRTLQALNPDAESWQDISGIKRTDYSYAVTLIPPLKDNYEMEARTGEMTFTIVNRAGRLFIADFKSPDAPDKDGISLALEEKLEIRTEDGLAYLISDFVGEIDFGKPYGSKLITEGISPEDAGFITDLAHKRSGVNFISAAYFVKNLPKRFFNFFAGFFAPSAQRHVLVNYHFIKQSGIVSAVEEFGGAASLTPEGYVNLFVYVINERPQNYADMGFKNTGVSINGNPLWASVSKGAVIIYGEGASRESVSAELASNRKINELIKQSAGRAVKTNLKNISVEWIEIGRPDAGKTVTYSENGNVKAGYALFKQMLERGEMPEFSASLRKVKNIDGFTLAQGILHNLDDITEAEDFLDYLKQHRKIGNGQIIINPELAGKIIEKTGTARFKAFLNAATKDGVQVFLLSDSKKMPAAFKEAGFSGHLYIDAKTKKAQLYNYALATASQVSIIENIGSPEALESEIKKAGENVLLNNSQLKNIINSQKSGIAIGRIIELLSSFKILKMFTPEKMTEDFALKAARNFEISDMPETSPEKIDAIMKLYSAGDFKGIINSLNLAASHPISVYIMKLESQTGDIKVYNAFVSAITEKILAAGSLRKVHKPYGLENHSYEIILGRALVLQALENSKGKGISVDHNALGATMKEAEEKLYETLQNLMPKAFEDKEPQALNAIAELIPEIAEERRKKLTKDEIKPDMDMKSYENILFAA